MTDTLKKDAYYFPHDSNAHDDPKIIKLNGALGLEGYGIYWLLLELLRDQPGYQYPVELIPDIADRYKTTKEKLSAVVYNFKLFEYDQVNFWSPSFIRRMQIREEIRQVRSLAGLKSGEARHNRKLLTQDEHELNKNEHELNKCSTNDEQMFNKIEQGKERKGKERKGNKRKGNKRKLPGEDAADYSNGFVEYFNSLRDNYKDLDYDTEFIKFKDYWKQGTEYLVRPTQAWSNWLDKARQRFKDQGPSRSLPAAAGAGTLANIRPIMSGVENDG